MSFRRELAWTLIVQGFGAAAVLASVLLVGTVLGPLSQGLFSRIKSELEFISALSMLGMPQAAFYFLRSDRMTQKAVLKVTVWLSAAAWIVALAYVAITHAMVWFEQLLFAAAASAVVVHGMLRVLVLARSTTRGFNVVTLVPQILVFLQALFLVIGGGLQGWHVSAAFLVAFALGSVLAWRMLRTAAEDTTTGRTPTGELLRYGLCAWLVSALSSLASVVWLRHIETSLGLAAVGVFAMGLTSVQVVLTPFTYAAPLLFRRWVGSKVVSVLRPALLSGLVTAVSLALIVGALGVVSDRLSLGAYAGLHSLAWFFVGAAAAEVVVRVAAVAANAACLPWVPALAELSRITLLGGVVWAAAARTLPNFAAMWSAAATFAAITLMCGARWARSASYGSQR